MLNRAFDIIGQTHSVTPGGQPCRIVLPPPNIARIGTKRTSFINFGSICKM